MKVFSLIASVAVCLFPLPLLAQQSEPGTGSTRIAPADKAPQTVQAPNLRVDSKPHTSLSPAADSIPLKTGFGVITASDLGPDILPVTPVGMQASAAPDNPRYLYYSLLQHTADGISPGDAQILAGRHAELEKAAESHGFRLNDSNWTSRQTICPAMQPDAEAITGVPPGGDGQGFILLHYSRDARVQTAFTAIVPRSGSLPVRILPAARVKIGKKVSSKSRKVLNSKGARVVINEALPPGVLYANLQPKADWIAASACIAVLAGSSPSIPDQPDLGESIITAPSPMIKLRLDGSRELNFTDRNSPERYTIWTASVSKRGVVRHAGNVMIPVKPLLILNPPVPAPVLIANIPDPPMRITAPPPSPIPGEHQ